VVTYITEQPFFHDSVNERPSDNEARRRGGEEARPIRGQMEGKDFKLSEKTTIRKERPSKKFRTQ